ncbi:MAG: hypothetical protein RQ855_00835 [Desulfurococcales archaeon]|nr:hypothetical protein [Desulfurococcales archaeon]
MLLRYNDVVILSAVRTPIGKFGKSLRDLRVSEPGAIAIREAIERGGVDVKDIGLVVMGNVIKAGGSMLTSKQASLMAGLPPLLIV